MLVSALIKQEAVDFSKVMSIEPKVDFPTGLSAPSPPINLMTLELLGKASLSNGDVGIVASMPETVHALVWTWLCAAEVAVHQKAQALLEQFLVGPHQNELMWRRFLGDKSIYGLLFSTCSLKTLSQEGQLSRSDKTIAQGRLLALLPKIDNQQIRSSQCRTVEEKYGVGSLLDFATLSMVDYNGDVLMHMTLIQFFTEWLRESANKVQTTDHSSLAFTRISSSALDYMIEKGLHSRTIQYFANPSSPDIWDARHLCSSSAEYIEVYFSTYANHALGAGWGFLKSTLRHICQVLDSTSPGVFISSPPTIDLAVLACVPCVALLLRDFSAPSPLIRIPIQPPNATAFDVLGKVFNSRHPHTGTKSAARALYFLYMEQHPLFWSYAIKAAETLALKDTAIAAGRFVLSIINADWEPMEKLLPSSRPEESMFLVRNEEDLVQMCHVQSLPPTGYLAILASPALESVVPWLLSPAQRSSDLGVGGKGDVEGAANSVAEVNYDALQSLYQKLDRHSGAHGSDPAWQDVLIQMRKRLAQGRWGGASGVGGSVATSQR